MGSALFVGLVRGLTSGEIQIKTAPNQGIWQSARNACRAGVTIALVGGLAFGLVYGLAGGARGGLLNGIRYGLAIGPIGGLIGGLLCGGLACIQHFVLRVLLFQNGDIPWNYAHFLDSAAGRLFLRKVGGGYIFLHRLLQEHFAGREE